MGGDAPKAPFRIPSLLAAALIVLAVICGYLTGKALEPRRDEIVHFEQPSVSAAVATVEMNR